MTEAPIRDLDAPEERTGQRSNRMLVIAVVLALVAGGGAAVLKEVLGPSAGAPPHNLVLPVDPDAAPDGAALRARLLTELIEDSRLEPNPARLPAFQSFVMPCRRAGPACSEVVERLGQDGVPWNLVRSFAAALPPRADADADALLLPTLAGDDDVRAQQALDVLRDRRRVEVGSATSCGCGFGLVPKDPTGEAWLVAFSADGEAGLAWDPQEAGGAWVLGVTRDAGGSPLLRKRISVGEAPPQVRAVPDGPAAGRRSQTLPPRPSTVPD